MFSLFDRAHRQLNLSPTERAILKLLEGFGITAAVAALQVAAELLAHQSVNLPLLVQTTGAVFVAAFLGAALKYARAHGDLPLEEIITPIAQAAAAKVPASAPAVPSGSAL